MVRASAVACVLLLGAPAWAQPVCGIRGDASVDVTVTPPGMPSFSVRAGEGVTVQPRPGPDQAVLVSAALAFRGTAREAPMRLRREVSAVHGLVRVTPAASIERVRAGSDGRLRVSAKAGSWVTVHGVDVDCDAVELGPGPSGGSYSCNGPGWIAKANSLVLRTRPGGGASIRLAVHEPSIVCFQEVARDGEWLHLRWTNDAMSLEGWARRDRMRSVMNMGGGGYASCGTLGMCGMGHGTAPDIYQGPARLHDGARVFAAPGQGEWAQARGAIHVEIRHRRGEPFAQVVFVAGVSEICDTLSHAWVAVTDLDRPP